MKLTIRMSVIILITLIFASCAAAQERPGFDQIDLFVGGDDGYHTYRIPAMVVSLEGTALAFCEARRDSPADHGNVDLVVKRSTDCGATWGPMQLIIDAGARTAGNPAPVVDRRTGAIILPFTIENKTVWVTRSDDDGLTWSAPREITKDVTRPGWEWYATGPGHALQLSSGRLLVPCDHTENKIMHSHVIYSDDGGETWKPGGSLPKHTDESIAEELEGGAVYINMRSNHMRGMRAIAVSGDGGESWSDLKFDRELIEPVCQGSVKRFTAAADHGRNRLLFSNPASRVREKMTVKMSYDEARSWPVAALINEGLSGYSDLAVLPDMRIALLYERGEVKYHEKISFARFTLEWLTEGGDSLNKY